MMSRHARLLQVVAVLGFGPVLATGVVAQEPRQAAVAAAEAVGLAQPLEVVVGVSAAGWGKRALLSPRGRGEGEGPARKEPPRVAQLFDRYPVQDDSPVPLWNEQAPETELYCYLLSVAQRTERSTFERSARKDVAQAEVFAHPEKYRGQVVHLEGFLRKLRRIEAPPSPAVARGVSTLYIGWVFDPKEAHIGRPWYVVFTHDPGRLPAAGQPLNKRVTFDGYFFKRLRFPVEDSWFQAPLVIGHMPALVRELPNDVAYRRRGAMAAAGVACLGGPLALAGPLATGVFNQTWPAVEPKPWQEKLPEVAVKLDLSMYTIVDNEPVLSYATDPSPAAEALARDNVLAIAHRLSEGALKKGARKDLTFPHFMRQSEKYRGEVVHVEGTLARVRRADPTRFTREAGITDEYECWIFDPKQYGAHPMCLYVTEVPGEIKTAIREGRAERMSVPVAFDGYFFKRYRYQTGESKLKGGVVWRDAPLLLGRTIELRAFDNTPVEQGFAINRGMITLFLGLLFGTMALALGVAFFYRRGDEAIRARVAGASTLTFGEPPAHDEAKNDPTGADPSEFRGFPGGSVN